jgi:hypothetical protein
MVVEVLGPASGSCPAERFGVNGVEALCLLPQYKSVVTLFWFHGASYLYSLCRHGNRSSWEIERSLCEVSWNYVNPFHSESLENVIPCSPGNVRGLWRPVTSFLQYMLQDSHLCLAYRCVTGRYSVIWYYFALSTPLLSLWNNSFIS